MNINLISQLIKQVSNEEILPLYKKLTTEQILMKSVGDMVTSADLAAERSMSEKLKSLYPNSFISGEEAIAKDPEKLNEVIEAQYGFLIDPVDGTNNFIDGNERFAIMVVALYYGKSIASWIYLPMADKMAVAEIDSGAYLNGKRINLPMAPQNINQMIGAAHIKRIPAEKRIVVKQNLKQFK
jgi:fructose-1,6-bisphosphatase/inositol monophosphatase family enzyme